MDLGLGKGAAYIFHHRGGDRDISQGAPLDEEDAADIAARREIYAWRTVLHRGVILSILPPASGCWSLPQMAY